MVKTEFKIVDRSHFFREDSTYYKLLIDVSLMIVINSIKIIHFVYTIIWWPKVGSSYKNKILFRKLLIYTLPGNRLPSSILASSFSL